MKRLLIVSHAMDIGGAERALLGLLENLNTDKYSVDLFLIRHQGELIKYIPPKINVLPEIPEYSCLGIPLIDVIKRGFLQVAFGRVVGKLASKVRRRKLKIHGDHDLAVQFSHRCTLRFLPSISKTQYDLAISFLTPHYFVIHKVIAKTKVAWIHTDYGMVSIDPKMQKKMWAPYDVIASISKDVSTSFVNVFPEFERKIVYMPTMLPRKSISTLSEAFDSSSELRTSGIRILSVGRFTYAKNFDNVPELCKILRQKGLDVTWYIIGYGGREQEVFRKIAEAGMEDYVIVLGKKENPYPYIKACDIYVQPSRYEGKCVSVLEAQMLHKPVIITDYPSSSSQLKNGIDGVIVPLENRACAEAMALIIRDKGLLDRIVFGTYSVENDLQTIKKIEALMS